MAKEKKVQQITDMEVDFAQWYTDICRKAELVEYASVKGFTILRPYGYAIWENIQSIMDAEFKKTGHENVAMPVLIPESLLKKEGELVNGFAPEVAWVTMGGSEKLEERLAFRPTSETNVEVAGVEPASKQGTRKLSTRLSAVSSFYPGLAGGNLTRIPVPEFSHDETVAQSIEKGYICSRLTLFPI